MFVVGCMVPTLAVLAWTASERWPSTTANRLAAVEQVLGMRVEVGSLSTPVPGVYRAREVELRNVETGAVVLMAARATIDHRQAIPQVRLEGAKLSAGELALVANLVERTLTVDWPKQVSLEISELEWLGEVPAEAERLPRGETLVAKLTTTPHDQTTASRKWMLKLGEQGPSLQLDRNRQITPPATRLVLDTAGAAVPASWVTELGAIVVDGGPAAQFAGVATITRSQAGVMGNLNGKLDCVALGTALHLPVEATGSISRLKLAWQGERMESAEGLIEASQGTMGGCLARLLQFIYEQSQPGAQVADNATLEFAAVGMFFRMDHQALAFGGALTSDTGVPACVLDAQGRALFAQPKWSAPLRHVAAVLNNCGTDRADEVVASLPRADVR